MVTPSDSAPTFNAPAHGIERADIHVPSVEQLESFRTYLCAVAEREIHPRWRARLAASDLVQQTLIEAAQALPHSKVTDPDDLVRWLRRILANNMCDGVRRLNTARRDLGREIIKGKSALLRRVPACQKDCPQTQAIRSEESTSLDEAIAKLPVKYQQVIHWRHRDNRSFAEIAQLLDLSENAAQKLWSRAIDSLRGQMKSAG